MHGKYKDLIKNTAMFAFSNIVSKILLAMLLPLYTHVLTTSEYGVAEIITTISQLLIPVCSLAISESVYRFSMDKNENPNEVLKNGVFVASLGCLFIFGASFALRWYSNVSDWYLMLFIISTVSLFRAMISLYTQAIGNTWLFSVDNVIYNILLVFFNISMLLILELRLKGFFLSIILASCASIIFLLVKQKLLIKTITCSLNKVLLRSMIAYSFPMVMNAISWSMTNLVDKTMIADICTTSATGVYAAASKIPSVLSLITNVFAQAWGLSAIKDYENEKDVSFFSNVFLYSHLVVGICTLLVFVINNNLLKIILGEDFSDSITYTPVLILGMVFLSYSNFFTPFFQAAKKTRFIMYTSFVGAFVNVVLNILLIRKYGIMGACLATLFSYMAIALMRYIYSRKIIKINNVNLKFIITLVILALNSFFVVIAYHEILISLVSILAFLVFYHSDLKIVLKRRKGVK